MRTLIFSAFLSITAFAQVGAPMIGYVPDHGSIRPMYGLPAAGAIGETIAEGGWAQIAISPSQNFVIATDAANGEVLLVNLVKPSVTAISGASANPDAMAISPSGTSAALWFPLSGKLQTISGLPDSPTIGTIDASFLNASPLSIAVSDDGQWAAGIWSAGVYAFGPSGQIVNPATDPGVVALAFFHNNHALALATANRATSIADLGGNTGSTVLYDYSQQPLSPRAIAVSSDNAHAVVADASGKILNIATASGTAAVTDCGCSPTGLYGLGDALFRLNEIGQSFIFISGLNIHHSTAAELKLFDAAAGSVWIVPPALHLDGGRQ